MKWTTKAKIMSLCESLPQGDIIYKFLQKKFGRLDGNPWSRLTTQREMAKWLLAESLEIEGKTIFEVGTGHVPIVPIGFFLMGSQKVITVDLNRRVDPEIFTDALRWIANNKEKVRELYKDVVSCKLLEERLNVVTSNTEDPYTFMALANIVYLAPADATQVDLPDEIIDYHISNTVLEHIEPQIIAKIFTEASRIMKKEGFALHFIDLSDHFQHQDSSITKINFLQYSQEEWIKIAGNQFAYCNRMRKSGYTDIVNQSGLKIVKDDSLIDSDSIQSVNNGFPISDSVTAKGDEDLCTTRFSVLLKRY
jgi:Methyltransferase domain